MANINSRQQPEKSPKKKKKIPQGQIRDYDAFLGFSSNSDQESDSPDSNNDDDSDDNSGHGHRKKDGDKLEEGGDEIVEVIDNTQNNPWTQMVTPGRRESVFKLPLDHPLPLEGQVGEPDQDEELLIFRKHLRTAPSTPPTHPRRRTRGDSFSIPPPPTSPPTGKIRDGREKTGEIPQRQSSQRESKIENPNPNENPNPGKPGQRPKVKNPGKRSTEDSGSGKALEALKSNMSNFIKKSNIFKLLKKKPEVSEPPGEGQGQDEGSPNTPKKGRKNPKPSKTDAKVAKGSKIKEPVENSRDPDKPESGQGQGQGQPVDEDGEKRGDNQPRLEHNTSSSVQMMVQKVKFIDDILTESLRNPGHLNPNRDLGSVPQWSDDFSLRTSQTNKSDSDNFSIRTEDIFRDDDQVVDEDGDDDLWDDVSTTEAAVNESLFTLHHTHVLVPKKRWRSQSRKRMGQKSQLYIHSHVVTKRSFRTTNWNQAYESMTVKKCVFPISRIQLDASVKILTSLKFSKLTAFKNVLTFLQTCPNISRLSFSNVTVVQKRLFNEAEFDLLELPRLKELEVCNWLLSLTKSDYWLLNYFTKGASFPNLEVFTLRGSENMPTEKNTKSVRAVLEEIPDSTIVTKFLLRNSNSLHTLSIGGLGLKLMEASDAVSGRFSISLPSIQLTSLKVSLHPEGVQPILRNQKKLKSLSCSGFVSKIDEKVKNTLAQVMENNGGTLQAIGIFPCIIVDKSQMNSQSNLNAFVLNCEMFAKCRRLDTLFINVTMATMQQSQRKSCGRLWNIPMIPLTLSHLELYSHEFSMIELAQLGDRFSKFTHLKSLVLSSNANRLYIVHLTWIKSLFGHPRFRTADFFGGKVENMKEFKDFILNKPKDYLAMTKISDCLSFYRPRNEPPTMIPETMSGIGERSSSASTKSKNNDVINNG